MNDQWYEDHNKVCALASWLHEEKGYNARELIGYFEKPWHWSSEYADMRGIEAGTHGPCCQCLEITKDKDPSFSSRWLCPDCAECLAEVTF